MTLVVGTRTKDIGLELEKLLIEEFSIAGHPLINGRRAAKSTKITKLTQNHTTCDEDITNGEPVINLGAAWEKWCNELTR